MDAELSMEAMQLKLRNLLQAVIQGRDVVHKAMTDWAADVEELERLTAEMRRTRMVGEKDGNLHG